MGYPESLIGKKRLQKTPVKCRKLKVSSIG
jgi:hypothetical protein